MYWPRRTTASRGPWRAARNRASCRPRRRPACGEQIAAGQQFRRHVDAFWEACEHWADAQLDGRPATDAGPRDKKGLQRGRRGGSRRGDRRARRPRRRRGLGLRGDRGGGPPRGAAGGGARRRAPDQRRHLGRRGRPAPCACGQRRALRRPPGQDRHQRPGAADGSSGRTFTAAPARPGSARAMRRSGSRGPRCRPACCAWWASSAPSSASPEGHELVARLGRRGRADQARGAGGRSPGARDRRRTNARSSSRPPPPRPWRRRCTSAWTAPASPCAPRSSQGRAGKQPDGSAKTREVKLCTVWSAEGRDADGTPVRDAGSVTYSAAIESAASRDTDADPVSDFAARAAREATRRGFDRAAPPARSWATAPRGSGSVATEHFPDALQIVDRFHAKQHLSDVGKAIYGPTSALGRAWSQARHDELDAGARSTTSGRRSRAHAVTANAEARKCLGYVDDNRDRMRYRGVSGGGALHLHGRGRSRLQGGDRHPAETDRACTGRWRAPTPSSPCGAASSAPASRTSGSGGQPPPRELISQS